MTGGGASPRRVRTPGAARLKSERAHLLGEGLRAYHLDCALGLRREPAIGLEVDERGEVRLGLAQLVLARVGEAEKEPHCHVARGALEDVDRLVEGTERLLEQSGRLRIPPLLAGAGRRS